tara:strand:- start:12362 stop:12751 length:390 start_codon:yes stop_codon:yes gene_type:complete
MEKKIFVKFVSNPENDQIKTIIGIACTVQAINENHQVSVFFAGSATHLLDKKYIHELDKVMGENSTMIMDFMEIIISKATVYCSFASVKETLGVSEGDNALITPDSKIEWSGPPGVIDLAVNSDIQLIY